MRTTHLTDALVVSDALAVKCRGGKTALQLFFLANRLWQFSLVITWMTNYSYILARNFVVNLKFHLWNYDVVTFSAMPRWRPGLNGYRLFTLVTRRPYCTGRPKELSFTTLSLAMETMRMRLSVVKQSFFGPPGQYGRLVTRANERNLSPMLLIGNIMV